MEIKHRENETRGIFYINQDNHKVAELTYDKNNDIMVIDHTEVDKKLEGQGVASKLLKHAVAYAREHNFIINPLCPFAEVQFDRNPEYNTLRA